MLNYLFLFLLLSPVAAYAEGKTSETAFCVSSGMHDAKIRELRDRQAAINIQMLRKKKEEERERDKKKFKHKMLNQ